jgi:hypothetical protein
VQMTDQGQLFSVAPLVEDNAEDFIRECRTRSLANTESRRGTLG